jgi:glucose-1-phosphate thymidylyltransferase
MHAIVLAATYEKKLNAKGKVVPLPLLDLSGEPYLTTLVKKLAGIRDMRGIHIITNDVLKPELDEWAANLPPTGVLVQVISDGTKVAEDRLGAIGDLLFALKAEAIREDVLVVGGDNWFTYDLQEFVERSLSHSPAVVVTPLPSGVDHSRFGLVELDSENRIVRFLEKSERTRLPLRASCVYFLSASDLRYLDSFAQEHSTTCTPGTFIAWLVGRITVYGLQMTATWYDISGTQHSRLRGPDTLEFREELRKAVSPLHSPWQRAAARQMEWVSAPEDLLDVLHDTDPDKRIVAALLLGRTGHLLSHEGKQAVISELIHLLSDTACNQYDYGGFQSDEEDAVFVSNSAATALSSLGYENDVSAVFKKARSDGFNVCPH